MSHWLPTVEQARRILTMLKWWESTPRNEAQLGEWNRFPPKSAAAGGGSLTIQKSDISITFTGVTTGGPVGTLTLAPGIWNVSWGATFANYVTLPTGMTFNVAIDGSGEDYGREWRWEGILTGGAGPGGLGIGYTAHGNPTILDNRTSAGSTLILTGNWSWGGFTPGTMTIGGMLIAAKVNW
jgi:hypothetical protein